MKSASPIRPGQKSLRKPNQGFSLIELVVTVAIILLVSAIAVPMTVSAVKSFKLNAAAVTAANAISATRYQAIMNGYPFQLVLDPTTMTYQAKNKVPPAVIFSNTGNKIPIGGSSVGGSERGHNAPVQSWWNGFGNRGCDELYNDVRGIGQENNCFQPG